MNIIKTTNSTLKNEYGDKFYVVLKKTHHSYQKIPTLGVERGIRRRFVGESPGRLHRIGDI